MKPAIVATIPPYKKQSIRVNKKRSSPALPRFRFRPLTCQTSPGECGYMEQPMLRKPTGDTAVQKWWWNVVRYQLNIFWHFLTLLQVSKIKEVWCVALSVTMKMALNIVEHSPIGWWHLLFGLTPASSEVEARFEKESALSMGLGNWGWDSPLCGVFIWYTIWLFNRAMENHHV